MPNTYPRPEETDLTPICGGDAFMQHRDGDTLIWPPDWWDLILPIPFGVVPGRVGADVAGAWFTGFLAGRESGLREGRRAGFRECEAGLRAAAAAGRG